jgi:Uma2 family endonuclease
MSSGLLYKASLRNDDIPLLYPGDHLKQPEFHRRYEAYPDPRAKFELIGGIVYMMAPAGYEHSKGDYRITGLIFQYERATPGVEGGQNVTLVLGENSEPQPDNVLMIRPAYGGKVRISGKTTKFIQGPPELVFEVAHSSLSIDLHEKRHDYCAGGVSEYIVLAVDQNKVYWFDLRSDEQLKIPPDRILRSRMFPGFWIDTRALMARDIYRLADCLDRGIAADEHSQFVEELAERRRHRPGSRAAKRPKQNGE